ncbi:MAG: hydrogenase nickel incorporation protein HypB [Solobacterium sp.]|jgi:hydrogenase nickel incorporation protein HypB|nr:hydrogenase nickel incorporation protein HypB [Solobacterium sp.]MCH4205710.1 hydrogenase nickel incorporation protein HypB [Solobacterium sp.]MCH4227234.1 hydrogenase nickel incorporation protein HypB [Solobacterium sp.]MCH4282540.1 hydrogenase nickel incorporation protein HypB [Solobacterium sp.]
MDQFEIFETKERIEADNDREAAEVRKILAEKKIFLVNLMSSPGAGKTTCLVRTIHALQKQYRIGVMEADVDSDVDAKTIAAAGARAIQLHTGGSCHMDADMTKRGLEEMGLEDLDVIFLENVGNLVCPAEFDVGANKKVMILSVPEGDDKPLKYPLMFRVSDVMIENKIDVAEVFDYDFAKAEQRAKALNPAIQCFRVSSLTGDGFDAWISWLQKEIEEWRKHNESH